MPNSPEHLQTIQLRAREWARVLKLPFRQQRWRGHAGEFAGTGVGSSLDFQDHRVYLPGDDPRQINWQAYARTGTYTIKQYREEVRPLVDVILDASDSMFAHPAKAQRTQELLAYAVEAALQTGATVRCYAVRGQTHLALETEAVIAGRWAREVQVMKASADAPALARIPLRAGAMRVFISDLLFPAEPEALLAPLGSRNGRGIVFVPHAMQESAPAWDGNYEFIDSETQLPHEHRVESDILQSYLRAYARHFDLWKNAAAKHGVALARVSAEDEFISALRAEGVGSNAVEAA
ncbi:MAG: DUF58 domain-containing protein [Verrucomicrobia bacterium]|nr:DUF58 domain-containing protein [Verrucomicrobiota bacterium]